MSATIRQLVESDGVHLDGNQHDLVKEVLGENEQCFEEGSPHNLLWEQ